MEEKYLNPHLCQIYIYIVQIDEWEKMWNCSYCQMILSITIGLIEEGNLKISDTSVNLSKMLMKYTH